MARIMIYLRSGGLKQWFFSVTFLKIAIYFFQESFLLLLVELLFLTLS